MKRNALDCRRCLGGTGSDRCAAFVAVTAPLGCVTEETHRRQLSRADRAGVCQAICSLVGESACPVSSTRTSSPHQAQGGAGRQHHQLRLWPRRPNRQITTNIVDVDAGPHGPPRNSGKATGQSDSTTRPGRSAPSPGPPGTSSSPPTTTMRCTRSTSFTSMPARCPPRRDRQPRPHSSDAPGPGYPPRATHRRSAPGERIGPRSLATPPDRRGSRPREESLEHAFRTDRLATDTHR